MRVSMESRGDGGQCGREPRQAGVELMDGGAERVAGDVEGHGHQGHGGDDALDLEAQGLIGGDGDAHGVGGGKGDEESVSGSKAQQVAQLLVDLNQ